MAKIKIIEAKEVTNSQGNPTVDGRLILDDGLEVTTSIPTNANTLPYQSVELKTSQAVSYINNLISPKLIGISPEKQFEIDGWLLKADSTKNKSKLGVNTIYIISSLINKAGSLINKQKPWEYLNSLYEKRLNLKINNKKIPTPICALSSHNQEVFIISSTSATFSKSFPMLISISRLFNLSYHIDNSTSIIEVIEGLTRICEENKFHFGRDVFLGINFLSKLKTDNFISVINNITQKYLPLMIFDPLSGDGFSQWRSLNENISKETYLVSDIFTHGNFERIEKTIAEKSCSSFMLRPSEIGTITEMIDLTNLIKKNNLSYIIGSGDIETEDTFVADLSVGLQSEFVSFGPIKHSENVSKYNRMMEIEKEITNLK